MPRWPYTFSSTQCAAMRPIHEVEHVDETRFPGLKRECGLHEIDLSAI